METSGQKSELIREPDLLSDVSEMKQDLIKMTAILTVDSTEKSASLGGDVLEKGAEEESGEALEIMEKDLEKVKEDLEKVNEILRSGTYEVEVAEEKAKAVRMAEEWVLLSDSEIDEAKKMAASESHEPVLRGGRGNRCAPRPKAIKDSGDLRDYLLDAPASSKIKGKKQPMVHEKLTDVPCKSVKPTTSSKVQEKDIAGNVKKPLRRKGNNQGLTEESREAGAPLALLTAPSPASPVSPVVEETPIGSIKDKVKALQNKVEAEQKSKKAIGSRPSQLPVMSKLSPKAKESPTSKQDPHKSPKHESEKLEESMSVKELMQAFQTGQDPSKRKSGLFQLKTSTMSASQKTTNSETIQSKSVNKAITTHVSKEQAVSLDSKPCPRETTKQGREKDTKSSHLAHSELSETGDFDNSGLDDSPDSVKHQGVADSPSGSSGDGTPHLISEDSCKHEGLATPGSSLESMCLSPKSGQQTSKTMAATAITVKRERRDKETSGDSGVATTGDLSTELTLPPPSTEAADDHTLSESISSRRSESKPAKPQKFTKRISETLENRLTDDESPIGQLTLSLAASPASRSSSNRHEILQLPLRQQDSEVLSPQADDSLTISHRDSLEGSPLMEENSSHNSPDSIEPSPTKESPCHDSLECSPVELKIHSAFPATTGLCTKSSTHPETHSAPELPQDALSGRLHVEHMAGADEDICEQTSRMRSSGKPPHSPDTATSEEVSCEVNPKLPADIVLSVQSKTTQFIPEDPEEMDASESNNAKRKFTPEEEMFKMVAKIKTFDEMDQESRIKKSPGTAFIPSTDVQTGDDSYKILDPREIHSQRECELIKSTEDSDVSVIVDPHIKMQPPSPFSAGLHEGSLCSEAKNTTTTATISSEGPHSVSDQHHSKFQLKLSQEQRVQERTSSLTVDEEGVANKAAVTSNTEEEKEKSLRNLKDNKGYDGEGQQLGADNLLSISQNQGSIATDEVKGDPTLANVCGPTQDTFKPRVCISRDRKESDETVDPPRTESKGITAKVEVKCWTAMQEDDDAFAVHVKEEEQKILNLVVDRQSLQPSPDTTPGRTPTEESTPTSEPNPFLFQEGKLFEMTRSGAIDMTKRSYEDDGGGFAFFQIGEQHLQEPHIEVTPKASGSAAETQVGLNLTTEQRTEEDKKIDSQSPAEGDQTGSKSDASKSKIPKMVISASATSKDLPSGEGLKVKTDKSADEGLLDSETSSSDQIITNVHTAETTVTRSVYSEQGQKSSDSSPEEPRTVLEAPKPTGKSKQSVSSSVRKTVAKTQAKTAHQGKPTTPISSHGIPSSTTLKKETSFTSESKSKIPIKANKIKLDSPGKHVDFTRQRKSTIPVKKDTRRKSETDAGPSVGINTNTSSSKAKSFCEGEPTSPSAKKQGSPLSVESTKSKGFHSRLPKRGKAGPSSHSIPTAEKSKPCTQSIENFEKISDEAAKLVERLVQAGKGSRLIDASSVESKTFQFPSCGGTFPIRAQWDDPVETQMQRIPDDKSSQGIPLSYTALSCASVVRRSCEGAVLCEVPLLLKNLSGLYCFELFVFLIASLFSSVF